MEDDNLNTLAILQELLALRYRANVLEQTVLRLLEHLAVHDADAALQIANEVKAQAMELGNKRDHIQESKAQEQMLELVNLLMKAANEPRR